MPADFTEGRGCRPPEPELEVPILNLKFASSFRVDVLGEPSVDSVVKIQAPEAEEKARLGDSKAWMKTNHPCPSAECSHWRPKGTRHRSPLR